MEKLYIEDLSEGEMHTQCKICHHFIEYSIKDGNLSTWKDEGLPVSRYSTLSEE